jgi:LacI family repressor for deo operon, udp, cdd, tsx, nupC, and nupG
MSAPTIRKVAALAGVSTATVSRALSHPGLVSEATREKVLAAVGETGFVPNRQAVDFRRRATGNIVLLVRDITNPFYLDIYRGVEEHAFANGYRVLMGDGIDDARIGRYVEMVRNRQADGLILMTGRVPEALRHTRLPPIVVVLETVEGLSLPTVAIDNRAAARLAVEHLLGLGHRRIAHVTGPMHLEMARERHAGYRDALVAAGIAPDPALTVAGDFHFSTGRRAAETLLAARPDVTAIFLANDEMAVGAVGALRTRGLSVPGDVSVVGFDDVFFAEASDPPLTSVRQPRREIGRAAMAMMIGRLGGEAPPDRIMAGVELVVRASSAPPPAETGSGTRTARRS